MKKIFAGASLLAILVVGCGQLVSHEAGVGIALHTVTVERVDSHGVDSEQVKGVIEVHTGVVVRDVEHQVEVSA